jgi:hypothetical protein
VPRVLAAHLAHLADLAGPHHLDRLAAVLAAAPLGAHLADAAVLAGGGAGLGGSGGILGGLGGMLGIGAVPVFGGSGGGVFGSGPVGGNPMILSAMGGGTATGGSTGLGSIGSSIGGGMLSKAGAGGILAGLQNFLGFGGGVQYAPGMATTWAASTFGQKLSALGRSNAALAAGGLLAFDGLRRGGWLGQTTIISGSRSRHRSTVKSQKGPQPCGVPSRRRVPGKRKSRRERTARLLIRLRPLVEPSRRQTNAWRNSGERHKYWRIGIVVLDICSPGVCRIRSISLSALRRQLGFQWVHLHPRWSDT